MISPITKLVQIAQDGLIISKMISHRALSRMPQVGEVIGVALMVLISKAAIAEVVKISVEQIIVAIMHARGKSNMTVITVSNFSTTLFPLIVFKLVLPTFLVN